MFQKGFFVRSIDDSKSIVHKPFPQCREHGDVARALISKSSINKFATMGLMGDPMAGPSFCSYNLSWSEK